ncbi:MAG: PAS domain S-box protein [Candidatus Acidiferrum sp.]
MRENEDHYRDLVENSLDLICTHDLNGVLLTVNVAAARTLGYAPEELENRNLREFLSPNLHKELAKYLAAVREKGAASGFMSLRTKSGDTRIWKYTNTLRTEGVQVPFVRGMAHDFTDILQAQKALRESEERLRVAAEVGRMYAWEWDPTSDSVLRSAECAGILGLDDASQKGVAKDYFALIHPDDRAGLWSLANSLTPKESSYRTQYRRFRPDGTLLWLEESGRATFDEAGKMVRLVGMTADITEGKQAEEKLRASEDRSRQIVQRSPVAMLVTHGLEQKNELLNDKFTALFGYSLDEIPSVAQWWSLAYPDDMYREKVRVEWQMRVKDAIKKGSEIEPMEAMVRCKDGSYRYVQFYFASLGETNLVSVVDLTDRKIAQEELAKVGGRLIEAQEEERSRIARELHDDIGQQIALLAIELAELGGMPLESCAGIRKHINKLQKHVSELCKDVEAISHELHSSKLELLGLKAAVRSLCKEFANYHKVKVDFHEKDLPKLLPKDIAICLFRVAQEALRNGVKHSQADRFQVQLSGRCGSVCLSVRDAGVGFDPETVMNRQGLGLISMRERITLVKGTIAIRSKPQGGTEIHCSVPLPPDMHDLSGVNADDRLLG